MKKILKWMSGFLLAFILMGIGSQASELPSADVQLIGQNDTNTVFDVNVSNITNTDKVSEILIPVWSAVNGQDDLVWYKADKIDDDDYTYRVNALNHKGLGAYRVDVYCRTTTGELIQLARCDFETMSPSPSSVEIAYHDNEKGTFTVMIKGIQNAGLLKKISVPIWSEANGQDDLVWYTALADASGDYYVNVDISKHKYSYGSYKVDTYFTDVTGNMRCVSSIKNEIAYNPGTLAITKLDNGNYQIVLNDFDVPGEEKDVLFPIWSESNGQDDIKWYQAARLSSGEYGLILEPKNHKGLGLYHVHAYVKKQDNSLQFLTKTTFETEAPKIQTVKVASVDKNNGTFTLKLEGISNEALIKNIKVPVWSDASQKDLVWYTAKKNVDGEYVLNVDISNHKYNTGTYKIDCWIEDVTGGMTFACKTTCDMTMEYESLNVTNNDDKEMVYQITLTGLKVPAGAKNVKVAVWGDKNGQNDIIWHTADSNGNNTYSKEVRISDHKESGVYHAHAYCETKTGALQFIAKTTFEVTALPMASNIEVTETDGRNGTFRVTVYGVMGKSGITKVSIPMWCDADQNDIKWYPASKVSEGVYTAVMNVSEHKYHFGTYKIDVYATMGNGIQSCIGSTTQAIQADHFIYSTYVSATQRKVWIQGAYYDKVEFPSWSNTNGQDDVKWYAGTNHGNGTWSATVDSTYHKSVGDFTTHVYGTSNGSAAYLGATTYELQWAAYGSMATKANWYSSTTPYLILVDCSNHKVGIFKGFKGSWSCEKYWDCADGAPSTPTVKGTFTVGSRGYYFNSGAYRCYWWTQFYNDYLFHSVLYNWSGVLQDGRVGMALSHGCVRLQIDNAKWIYDNIPTGTTVVVY